jgi:hypothetical protein
MVACASLHAHDVVAAIPGEPTECAQRVPGRGRRKATTSRRDALRRGLIAETVIDGLEDAERRSNTNSCCASRHHCGALRPIIAVETDLFQSQARNLRDRQNEMTTVHGNLTKAALDQCRPLQSPCRAENRPSRHELERAPRRPSTPGNPFPRFLVSSPRLDQSGILFLLVAASLEFDSGRSLRALHRGRVPSGTAFDPAPRRANLFM